MASAEGTSPAPVPAGTPVAEPPATDLNSLATTEGIAALGLSPMELTAGLATATATARDLKASLAKALEDVARVEKEKGELVSSSQRDRQDKAQQLINLLKLDVPMTEEDEKAYLGHYSLPKTVEESQVLNNMLTMQLANKIENNRTIRMQEEELLRYRSQFNMQPSGGFGRYNNAMAELKSAAAVDEPLASPNKRFATEALKEAVARPSSVVAQEIAQEETPRNPFAQLAAAFLDTAAVAPPMGPRA